MEYEYVFDMDINTAQSSHDHQQYTVRSPQLPENDIGGGTGGSGGRGGLIRPCGVADLILPGRLPGSMAERARLANIPPPQTTLKCPRCDSTNTKFCYFNNYNLTQPRHYCKACRRYWTRGGALRNVPVGGGCRRIKRSGGGGSSSRGNSESQDRTTSNDQYHHRPVANNQMGSPSSSISSVVRNVSQSEHEILSPSMPADDQLSLSDLEMVQVIGKGSTGVVHLVQHKRTDQLFALKVIEQNINEAIRKAIEGEVKITLSSQCPYLVTLHHAFYENGAISLILEYMDGGSLADFLKSVKAIPEEYLSAIFKQVIKGLTYLHHDRQIIHCDLKPSNLLMNHKGEVKITDFGVSQNVKNTAGLANAHVGTYNYMSPERILGNKYGIKSDIWSLGLVVLECATGKFPYAPPGQNETWTSVNELIDAIVEQPTPALPSENFSPELSSFISSCLQKDPDIRSSAKELLEHPFLRKYNKSGINLESYFTDARSPKLGSPSDVIIRNHLEDWGTFCEFLRSRQPPRLLCECTAGDAIEFLRLFPSEKIDAVVSSLSTASLRKIDGKDVENPFESPVVRTFLKGLLREQTSEVMKRDETVLSSETNRNLIGIRSQLNSILSLLNCSQSSTPDIVGIWGMAGIGKTTISREIFKTQAEKYDVCYFLPDFHLMCQTKGLTRLRDEFFSKICGEDNVFIDACDTKLSFTRDRFLNKRVLIVLDGVSNARDVEVLVGGFGWFSGGHTIILTSRNRQVLVQCNAKKTYEIQKLSETESAQLCREVTPEQVWKGGISLISELVNYASGNPLALQVLCSSVQKQCINDEKHLSRLRQYPPIEIQDAFRRSFHVLDDNEKSTFLDLACFFRGENKDRVVNILDGCGIFTDLGIYGLLDESLISLVDNRIEMPNIFQDMGRFVVCQEHEEACKRSRLWDSNDIADVLINNLGTEAIEGIFLDGSGLTFELSSTVFEKMYRLRLLKLHCPTSENHCNICLPQGLYSLPDELRLLHWESYPLGSLPRNFNPKNLVELNMPYSNITKLWKGTKNLEKLKRITLSHSQQLTKFPRLSKARNLEHIDLEGCTSLVKVHSSILHHQKLTFLSLKDCTHLRMMPTTVHLESLEVLNLSGCSELEDVHDFSPNLIELYLAGTAIREMPSSLGDLNRLATLDLQNCTRLQHLPPEIRKLKAVVILTTKDLVFSMNLSSMVDMAPQHKGCRLKRVIQTVILSLRKRKREKSLSTATNQVQLGSAYTSVNDPSYKSLRGFQVLPERLGQPECQYYMKTGDCKDGNVCKFHHPRYRETHVPEGVSFMASKTRGLHLPGLSFPLGYSSSSEFVEASTKKLRIQTSMVSETSYINPLGRLPSFGTSSLASEITQATVGRDTNESNQGEEKGGIYD